MAITIQKDEAIILCRSQAATAVPCPHCAAGTPMVSPEEAVALFGIPLRRIFRAIEAGRLHFQESAAGALSLCLNSLQEQFPFFASDSTSPNQKP